MDYSSDNQIRRKFQIPPPPSTELPDWGEGPEDGTGGKSEIDCLARSPRTPPLSVMSRISDSVVVTSGMRVSGVTNQAELHRYLMSVYASRSRPLIRDCACFRQIEAMDLAISDPSLLVNKPNSLQMEATAKFVGFSDRTLNSCDVRSMDEVSDWSALSKTNATLRGQLSPPILNIERYLCSVGHPLEITKSPIVSRVSKTSNSKGVQCSFVEWPSRATSIRDHRRKRAVAPLPMIAEVEQVSSGEDSMESKELNCLENKRVAMPVPAEPDVRSQVTSSSRSSSSLLDAMHKRYCSSQYKKQQSPRVFPRTSPGFQNRKTRASPPGLTLIVSTGNRLTVPSPTITLISSSEESALNLPSVHVSPSSISSLESPLASPLSPLPNWNWFDEEPCKRCWTDALPASETLSCSDIAGSLEGSPAALRKSYCHVCCKDNCINLKSPENRPSPLSDWVELHSWNHTGMDDSLHTVGYSSVTGSTSDLWRRPESMWMEYIYEWNPLLAEVEAVEACEWLREAGFPQYAQMYKDNLFPINLKAAEKDHDFLDQDALQAVFRRLNILNKCSSSKLKRSPVQKSVNESDDEEEECALSSKWKFQRNSRLWSRIDADLLPHLISQPDASFNGTLCSTSSSHDSALDDTVHRPPTVGALDGMLVDGMLVADCRTDDSRTDSVSQMCCSATSENNDRKPDAVTQDSSGRHFAEVSNTPRLKRPNLFLPPLTIDLGTNTEVLSKDSSDHLNNNSEDVLFINASHPSSVRNEAFPVLSRHLSDDTESGAVSPESISPGLRRAASDKFRGALSMLRRVEGLKIRKSSRKGGRGELTKLDIGNPVLIESPEILLKVDSLHCTDISPVMDKTKDLNIPQDELSASKTLSNSSNIPQISEDKLVRHLRIGNDVHKRRSMGSDNPSFVEDSQSSSKVERDSRRSSVKSDTTHPEEAREIVAELLKGLSAERPTSGKSQPRISVYDNVGCSSELTSTLQKELDMLLKELYKDISSLDYSMSRVDAGVRAESPASSVGTLDEDDPSKASVSQASKRNQESVESTDGNVSTTPSEGSYHMDGPAKADPAAAFYLFIDETNLEDADMEDPFEPSGDAPTVPLTIPSDQDSTGSAEQREDDWSYPTGRERRDSGVGSSLTRTASSKRQKRPRLRWHSFTKSHQISLNGCDLPISNLSAGQLAVLRKLSLLKVTAALEKYSPANRANWSWFVPRLKRRAKMPDYSDRTVFGIPIAVTQQRHGHPLPQCILYAMRHLRRSASESIGIFRKSGVRSRVQALRIALESDADGVDFEGLQAYDVADLLKLYFRELPECLLTNKLSNIFISIFLYVPVDLRPDLIRSALILLPDEHRLTLQSLLLFLTDMAQHSESNQMNACNLAVCFAPSLFHLCSAKWGRATSPKQIQKRPAVPSEKNLMEQKVAHECLTYMITNAKRIFTVSQQMLSTYRLSYLEQGDPVPLQELCRKSGKCDSGDYSAYVDSCVQGVLKESRDKFKGWISLPSSGSDVDLTYKKVGDGHPLRLWKFCVDVEAPPEEVLNRVLRERHLWDDDILKWRIVEKLDSHTEVFQYVLNSMVPHPTRDFSELRSWRTDLPRGTCILISTSVEHPNAPLMGDVRAVVLASRYLIEPCGSGKSRLTHIIRIDLRGHSPDWYNGVYGHICVSYAQRIRDSFKTSIALTSGPETKV